MAEDRRSSRGGSGASRGRGAPKGRGGASGGPKGRGGPKGGPKGRGGPKGGGGRPRRPAQVADERTQSWGGLARRGASRARADQDDPPEESPGRRDDRRRDDTPEEAEARALRRAAAAARRERLEDEARRAVSRARTDDDAAGPGSDKKKRTRRRASKLSPQSATTLRAALGKGAAKAESRLSAAAGAFEAERFGDAQRILRDLRRDAPQVPEIRELLGLTYYRLGKWTEAVGELEDFAILTGDPDQHPVLADCHRALQNWDRVDELWIELRDASPSAEIVTEGRIVAAGAAADRRDVARAIRILEKGWSRPKRPRPHHLRRAYALADLYERSGELPRARELFEWVASHEPDLADVKARVENLG